MMVTNSNGVEAKIDRKLLALAGAILFAIGGAAGSLTMRFIVENPSEQTHQNDRLNELERRVGILEDIAKTNSESRIRVDEQLKVIKLQHDEMMKQLSNIQDLLAKHERESRRQRDQP